MATPVTIPLINPNEPEALLAAVHVQEGQHVRKGDVLFSLETTKSSADVEAEADGYVAGLKMEAGQTLRDGAIFCYIADEPGWKPVETEADGAVDPGYEIPQGMRITQPALALAREHRLDLMDLPPVGLVTETTIRQMIQQASNPYNAPESPFDASKIIIYGGGGHGKMVIDMIRSMKTFQIAGIVDDGLRKPESILGIPVLGGREALAELAAQGIRLAANAVGGIGNIQVRIKVFQVLAEAGFACPTLVHATAYIDPTAELAAGAQVLTHAYVGSEARLGYGVIANTGSIVSHDCRIGDCANISPGAVLAGDVTVGAGALIGMGVTINLGVRIGQGARIGNGATIKGDVPEGGVVRAGTIWPE